MHGPPVAPACTTENVWPAIVSVPVRPPPVLAAALKITDPLPAPLPPEVIEIHVAPLLAAQAHPVPVDTTKVPLPPVAATAVLEGLMLNVQPG